MDYDVATWLITKWFTSFCFVSPSLAAKKMCYRRLKAGESIISHFIRSSTHFRVLCRTSRRRLCPICAVRARMPKFARKRIFQAIQHRRRAYLFNRIISSVVQKISKFYLIKLKSTVLAVCKSVPTALIAGESVRQAVRSFRFSILLESGSIGWLAQWNSDLNHYPSILPLSFIRLEEKKDAVLAEILREYFCWLKSMDWRIRWFPNIVAHRPFPNCIVRP